MCFLPRWEGQVGDYSLVHVRIFTATCGSKFLSLSFDTAKVQQFFRMSKYFRNHFLIFSIDNLLVDTEYRIQFFLEVEKVLTIILYYIYNII